MLTLQRGDARFKINCGFQAGDAFTLRTQRFSQGTAVVHDRVQPSPPLVDDAVLQPEHERINGGEHRFTAHVLAGLSHEFHVQTMGRLDGTDNFVGPPIQRASEAGVFLRQHLEPVPQATRVLSLHVHRHATARHGRSTGFRKASAGVTLRLG
jgi:hypothetical protein